MLSPLKPHNGLMGMTMVNLLCGPERGEPLAQSTQHMRVLGGTWMTGPSDVMTCHL